MNTKEKRNLYMRRYRRKYQSKLAQYRRQYWLTYKKKRKVNLEVNRIWRKNNKEKRQAQKKIEFLIRTRRLIPSKKCNRCSWKQNLVAHHLDYSKPFQVEWLCHSCHKLAHSKTWCGHREDLKSSPV